MTFTRIYDAACCTLNAMNAIADQDCDEQTMAVVFYEDLLHCRNVGWGKINGAIGERWGKDGLIRIKKMAWDYLENGPKEEPA